MVGQGLAVIAKFGNPMEFWTDWSTTRMTEFFEALFPKAFRYLDAHPYKANPTAIKWGLLIKSQRTLSLAYEGLPGGYEVSHYCRKGAKKWNERTVYISEQNILGHSPAY